MPITAIALNTSLKRSGGEASSTDRLLGEIAEALKAEGVETIETIRIADHDVKPGVTSDEGEGDAWPALRTRILAADILVLGGPIWMGQPNSIAKRVLERMDAFFDEKDDKGRTPAFGKVACCAVVGNEDGAHHVSAELFQALNDVGYTLAPFAVTYWVGEALRASSIRIWRRHPRRWRRPPGCWRIPLRIWPGYSRRGPMPGLATSGSRARFPLTQEESDHAAG